MNWLDILLFDVVTLCIVCIVEAIRYELRRMREERERLSATETSGLAGGRPGGVNQN